MKKCLDILFSKSKEPLSPTSKLVQLLVWLEVCNIIWLLVMFTLYIFYGFDDEAQLNACFISSLFITIIGSVIRMHSGYY